MTLDTKVSLAGTASLKVYPNPNRGAFMLELPSYSGKPLHVELFDITGKQVYACTPLSVYPVQVSPPELPSGIYLVRVKDGMQSLKGRVVIE
jgi:hypothetical protein